MDNSSYNIWDVAQLVDPAAPLDRQDPQNQGVVASWPTFLSAGSRHLRDVAGRYSGDIHGDYSWINDPMFGPTLRFGSGTGYVDTPYVPFVFPMCIELWFRTTGSGDMLAWGSSVTNDVVVEVIASTNAYYFVRGSSNYTLLASTAVINDGQWHALRAVSLTRSSHHLFIDGRLEVSDTTDVGTLIFDTTQIARLLRSTGPVEYFTGDIALPRVRYTADMSTAWQAWAPQSRFNAFGLHRQSRSPYAWPWTPTGGGGGTVSRGRSLSAMSRLGSRSLCA